MSSPVRWRLTKFTMSASRLSKQTLIILSQSLKSAVAVLGVWFTRRVRAYAVFCFTKSCEFKSCKRHFAATGARPGVHGSEFLLKVLNISIHYCCRW